MNRDFIVKGIQTGKLEYQHGTIWGNPYLKILRSQLEGYITEELGENYLARVKAQTEVRRIKKEISVLQKKLTALRKREAQLEESLKIADQRTVG